MPKRHLELEEAEGLLDVIFGVVVGLALVELPYKGWGFVQQPTLASAIPILLLISGLVFSAFYWIETRFFIDHQEQFDSAISKDRSTRTDGVRLPLATFLLGALAMMTAAAGILAAAANGNYAAFLYASLLYWLLDLGGTVVLRITYKEYWPKIKNKAESHAEAFNWYLLHIRSGYFLIYGSANACIIIILLVMELLKVSSDIWHVVGCTIILSTTLLRHLWLRSTGADMWLKKELIRANIT